MGAAQLRRHPSEVYSVGSSQGAGADATWSSRGRERSERRVSDRRRAQVHTFLTPTPAQRASHESAWGARRWRSTWLPSSGRRRIASTVLSTSRCASNRANARACPGRHRTIGGRRVPGRRPRGCFRVLFHSRSPAARFFTLGKCAARRRWNCWIRAHCARARPIVRGPLCGCDSTATMVSTPCGRAAPHGTDASTRTDARASDDVGPLPASHPQLPIIIIMAPLCSRTTNRSARADTEIDAPGCTISPSCRRQS